MESSIFTDAHAVIPLVWWSVKWSTGNSSISRRHSPFSTRWSSCSVVLGWFFSKSGFRMPKPHETHSNKGWHSTNWYRFIFPPSLFFIPRTPSEAKNKAPSPKEKQQEQQKSSYLYSQRLSARSAFTCPVVSRKTPYWIICQKSSFVFMPDLD